LSAGALHQYRHRRKAKAGRASPKLRDTHGTGFPVFESVLVSSRTASVNFLANRLIGDGGVGSFHPFLAANSATLCVSIIYFMHYNFVRIHQTLKITPAMARQARHGQALGNV
jgi:hypothetical protein